MSLEEPEQLQTNEAVQRCSKIEDPREGDGTLTIYEITEGAGVPWVKSDLYFARGETR